MPASSTPAIRGAPVDDTLELVGLAARRRRDAGKLSGGQRRRLDVALALIGDPELIFLDEPTTGFDPAARRDGLEMLDGLRGLGKTIFLTTHYMEEAERLADRIAVIAGGRIVDEGTPATIGHRDIAASEILFSLPPGDSGWELPDDLLALINRSAATGGSNCTAPRRCPTSPGSGPGPKGGASRSATLRSAGPRLEDVYLA